MDKYDLIFNANVTDDIERLKKLAQYDMAIGGMKLYRYRPVDEDHLYELNALKTCLIWASNPNLFDDEYELCTSDISNDDYKFVEFFLMRNARKQHRYPYQDLAILRNAGRRRVVEEVVRRFRDNRSSYVVSCFTENSPVSDDAMWHQYANDHGICLEYSLMSFVEKAMLIDPVYYIETKSLGDIFKLFGEDERAELMICVKNKYGIDRFSNTSEVVSWEKQKEWRYLLYNEKDENGKFKPGLYCEKQISPDRVYIKGLDKDWIKKVESVTAVNGIPVQVINADIGRRLYERIKGWQ